MKFFFYELYIIVDFIDTNFQAAQFIGFQKLLDLTCGAMEKMNMELKAVEEGFTAMSIEK